MTVTVTALAEEDKMGEDEMVEEEEEEWAVYKQVGCDNCGMKLTVVRAGSNIQVCCLGLTQHRVGTDCQLWLNWLCQSRDVVLQNNTYLLSLQLSVQLQC